MRPVAIERTGWRDAALSERHRQWGWNCPAVDLDFVMAEYNHGKTCALVEYKHRNARKPDLAHPTYQALADLANGYRGGPLPFFVAFYDDETWAFSVLCVNEAARRYYAGRENTWMTEQRFVESLYRLRKQVLDAQDQEAIQRLNFLLPSVALAAAR